jgi:MoaA/NifB/PqqE/SkfB family radical SAM enzyme
MFDFQQMVSDLKEEKLLPAVPGRPNQIELLKVTSKLLEQLQSKNIFPKELDSPLGCQLELTHRCNLRCKQCYNQSGCPTPDISFEKWVDVTRQLVDMNIFECVISGGEPLLLKDKLYKLMDILDDNGVRFIFVTNGLLMDERKVKRLSKYDYYWIQVSIDGSRPDIHDKIRGVKGSWKKAVNAAKMISQAGLPLVVSHVIQRDNIDYLDEMIEESYLLGAKRMITGKFTFSGKAIINRGAIDIDYNKTRKAYQLLKIRHSEYEERMDIVTSTDPAFYLRYRILEPSNVLLIRPNGDVKIDCILPFRIGNVLDEKISSIWDRIGKSAWKNSDIIQYIKSIKEERDMINVHPRPYVDDDVLIK